MSHSSIFTGADNTTALWGWMPNVPSAGEETYESRSKIIGRVHNLWQNDAISRAIINRITENTVGTGPRLQSQPEQEILGIDDKYLQAWSAKVEAKFRLFWESTQVDLAGVSTGANLCTILLNNVLVHGDSGIRFIRDKAGLRIQVIDGTRFESPFKKLNDPDIIAGVEVDPTTNAPKAYYINVDKPNSYYCKIGDPKRFERFEKGKLATDLVFLQARPNQYRGLPLLTPVVENLKKLHDLISAEVRGEQVRSTIAFAITTTDKEIPTKELDGNIVLAERANTRTSTSDYYGTDKSGENRVVLAEGKLLRLNEGDQFHVLQNPHVADVLKDLSNLLTMTMGACVGVPNEILMQVYNTSYTAARAARLDFDTKIRILRKQLYNWLCSRVYEYWLEIEIASGNIDAPGFFLEPEIRNAWLAHEFTGDSAGHIDPVKMANFFIPLVNAGLCSFERAMSELWGIDFTTEIARIASEREVLKELKLDDLIAKDKQKPEKGQGQGADGKDKDDKDKDDDKDNQGDD